MKLASFIDSNIKPVVPTVALLTLGIFVVGCNNNLPDPKAYNQPTPSAYVLSNGKIQHFIPPVGLTSLPTNNAMLEVCQQFSLNSSTAQGAYAIFSTREGKFPVSILIVGGQTLASLGDLFRNHDMPLQLGSGGTVILYPGSQSSVLLNPKENFAMVGGSKVALKNKAVYWSSDKQLIMSLPDLITIFHARDKKRGTGEDIEFVKIVYDVNSFYDKTRQ